MALRSVTGLDDQVGSGRGGGRPDAVVRRWFDTRRQD